MTYPVLLAQRRRVAERFWIDAQAKRKVPFGSIFALILPPVHSIIILAIYSERKVVPSAMRIRLTAGIGRPQKNGASDKTDGDAGPPVVRGLCG